MQNVKRLNIAMLGQSCWKTIKYSNGEWANIITIRYYIRLKAEGLELKNSNRVYRVHG